MAEATKRRCSQEVLRPTIRLRRAVNISVLTPSSRKT